MDRATIAGLTRDDAVGTESLDLGAQHLTLQDGGINAASVSDASRAETDTGSEIPLFESPTTYAAGYERTATPLNRVRARKTTQSPTSPLAGPSLTRKRTVHIGDASFRRALSRTIVHWMSVMITAILLVLNAAEVHLGGLDSSSDQNAVLQTLQYAAKFHELTMAMSLGDIVLHRIRWDLLHEIGVPFGFVTAAYQLSDLLYLASEEFCSSVWRPMLRGRSSFRRASLSLLIVVGCVLSLVVGPSSGVLMIPRLKWWDESKPFGRTNTRFFVSNATQDLFWPLELPSYPSAGWLLPFSGLAAIGQWATALQFNSASPQIPFTNGGDSTYRWLTSNATDYNGWSVTSSPMMVMGTYLGSYWNWINSQALLTAASLKRPRLPMTFGDGSPLLQPLVQVQCSAHVSNDTSDVTFHFPNDQLKGLEGEHLWPIPRNYTDFPAGDLLSYSGNIYWAKLATDQYDDPSSLGLIFVMPDDSQTKSVVPCSVLAHWVPGEISMMPTIDRNIHPKIPNPLQFLEFSDHHLSSSNQITFSDDWWALLLSGAVDGAPTSIHNLLYGLTQGPCQDCLTPYHGGIQGLAYRVSTLLGMYLTDAISRYVIADSIHTVYQEPADGIPFAQNLGSFELPHEPVPAGYRTWLDYAEDNTDIWREMSVKIQRQGYEWSFDGILIKFATAALLMHAALALVHSFVLLHGRWSSDAWDSIASMLTLALRSQRPAVPVDAGTGHEDKHIWSETVTVKRVGGDYELHFGLQRAHTLRDVK